MNSDYYSMLDFLYPEEVGRFFTISMDITVATCFQLYYVLSIDNAVVKALKDVSIGAIIIRDFDTIAFGNHYDIDSILPIEEFKVALIIFFNDSKFLYQWFNPPSIFLFLRLFLIMIISMNGYLVVMFLLLFLCKF